MLVGVGTRKPRGDLRAIHRGRHHSEAHMQRAQVKSGEMKYLEHVRAHGKGEKLGGVGDAARNLDDVRRASAWRQLDDAKPVATMVEPHCLGIDGGGSPVTR